MRWHLPTEKKTGKIEFCEPDDSTRYTTETLPGQNCRMNSISRTLCFTASRTVKSVNLLFCARNYRMKGHSLKTLKSDVCFYVELPTDSFRHGATLRFSP